MPSPAPFPLALGESMAEHFAGIRQALEEQERNPADRDAFILTRDASAMVRDLRPGNGVGEAIDQLVAFVHHAFLWWSGGEQTDIVDRTALKSLLGGPGGGEPDLSPVTPFYAALPERLVWAEVIDGAPVEPLHGCSVHRGDDGALRVLGIFGIRSDRGGFSVVESAGSRERDLRREDGTPLYQSRLAGGMSTDLHSIAGGEELLELGWRLAEARLRPPPV